MLNGSRLAKIKKTKNKQTYKQTNLPRISAKTKQKQKQKQNKIQNKTKQKQKQSKKNHRVEAVSLRMSKVL